MRDERVGVGGEREQLGRGFGLAEPGQAPRRLEADARVGVLQRLDEELRRRGAVPLAVRQRAQGELAEVVLLRE